MKAVILFFYLASSCAAISVLPPSARAETSTPRDDKIALHEKLAKAHLEAAQCLKQGKTLDECDKKLRASCPSGTLEACVGLSESDLRRHAQTHEQAGTAAKTPSKKKPRIYPGSSDAPIEP